MTSYARVVVDWLWNAERTCDRRKEHLARLARCARHCTEKSVGVWRACIYENAHKYLNGASIFDSHVALISLLDSIHHFVFMLHVMISGEWSSSAEEAGCIGIDYCWW